MANDYHRDPLGEDKPLKAEHLQNLAAPVHGEGRQQPQAYLLREDSLDAADRFRVRHNDISAKRRTDLARVEIEEPRRITLKRDESRGSSGAPENGVNLTRVVYEG